MLHQSSINYVARNSIGKYATYSLFDHCRFWPLASTKTTFIHENHRVSCVPRSTLFTHLSRIVLNEMWLRLLQSYYMYICAMVLGFASALNFFSKRTNKQQRNERIDIFIQSTKFIGKTITSYWVHLTFFSLHSMCLCPF